MNGKYADGQSKCKEETNGETCGRDTHERRHERDAQNDAPDHPDANNVEIVCPVHGILVSW
jgi:hypothetical protein